MSEILLSKKTGLESYIYWEGQQMTQFMGGITQIPLNSYFGKITLDGIEFVVFRVPQEGTKHIVYHIVKMKDLRE